MVHLTDEEIDDETTEFDKWWITRYRENLNPRTAAMYAWLERAKVEKNG